jgi:hypothetical protein
MEDVAGVKRFIQGWADLNPNPEVTDPPLATAVMGGNMAEQLQKNVYF